MTMGLGLAAGAAGLCALQDGVANAAEPSLLPPEAKIAGRAHRSPEQGPAPPGLQDGADDPEGSGSMGSRRTVRGDRLSWRTEAGLGQHRDRKPWLNVMRNSLNTQVWSFRHSDFLVVSATHGTAHLALFGSAMWEKYQLAKSTGGKFQSKHADRGAERCRRRPEDYENPEGAFSPQDNSIPALQRRGVVFLACQQRDMGACGEADRHRGEP